MTFQIDIAKPEQFKAELIDTPGTLQVVELYQSWCGPCKAIVSTFRRLYFDLGDKPLKFYTVDVQKLPGFEEYRGRCQPVFLYYKDGKVLEKVVGVQAPILTRLVVSLLETPPPPAA